MKTVLRFRQAIRGILLGFARIAWFAGVASSLSAAEPLATWTPRTSPTNVNFTAIAYGNNTFVAMAQDFGIAITSPDGVTWTKRTTPLPTREVYGLDYGGGLFVAAGDVGKIITSPDGITWTIQTSGTSRNLDSVAYLNNQFIVVGSEGAILTSPNGIAWTPHFTVETAHWRGVTLGGSTYVTAGINVQEHAIAGTTTDFTQVNLTPDVALSGFLCCTYGAGRYVAGGIAGLVLTSFDGSSWITTNRLGTGYVRDIKFVDGTFVSVSEDGRIDTSTTGTNWTKRAGSFGEPDLRGVAFGQGTFVAVGDSGAIRQSGFMGPISMGVVISNPAKEGTEFSFEFNGTVGQNYALQASTSLTNWLTLTNILCTASPMAFLLEGQSEQQRFYRLLGP